ncbi:hypothetical protein [Clostridium sp. L2-50]|uniref:hypothetical protein n=1 Tax=Clostridium sp. L2-50 TaxID=411489 RepID=UPI00015BD1D8|nr:hypothetical protein [Clostridium sp. L2-50]EDO59234.1 hypothetical protein CLOL250_00293 [Clostridium sp. L2-50]UEA75643.1 hypothetical protein LK416_05545 [Lachnospiraceae bacterium GAM79]UEA76377.1 hypothetical protein LK424_08895 [Lachnospiraceae bacterium GAM79]
MITINIYDLSNNPLSLKNGFYGGTACNKDGILIDDDEWIVKYPRSLSQMEDENASYSSLSEFLGSEIYRILGYDVHKTILGVRNNKLIVACKDFAIDGFLLEIRTIKNYLSGDLLDKFRSHSNIHSTSTHVVDIDELMFHLEKNPLLNVIDGIKQHFFEQALIDIFINNNDRTNDNWGILRINGQKDRIAPIFDNGASFSPKMSEDKIIRLLSSDELRDNCLNALTAYSRNGHLLSAKKFIQEFQDCLEFQKALNSATNRIIAHLDEIMDFINFLPEFITVNDRIYEVCSISRKIFYQKQLLLRFNELILPAGEKMNTIKPLKEF